MLDEGFAMWVESNQSHTEAFRIVVSKNSIRDKKQTNKLYLAGIVMTI